MFWLCRTCGVEHSTASSVCAICADDRQWVPAEGQQWATLEQLVAEGMRSQVAVVEDGLVAIGSSPALGIGQLGKLVCSDAGNVLWDPSGFVDDDAVAAVVERGPVIAIVASHPHMYGAQVEWSHRLGGVPVYVEFRGCRVGDASRPGDPAVVGYLAADPVVVRGPSRWAFPRQRRRLLDRGGRRARCAAGRRHHLSQPGPPHRCVSAQLPEPPSAVARPSCSAWPARWRRWTSTASTACSPTPSTPTATPRSSDRPPATPPGSAATTTT